MVIFAWIIFVLSIIGIFYKTYLVMERGSNNLNGIGYQVSVLIFMCLYLFGN